MDSADYEQIEAQLDLGDRWLLFSNGAVEITDRDSHQLGTDGLPRILQEMNYPATELAFADLERRLLVFSNGIRFGDDLKRVEMRRVPSFASAGGGS